MQISSFLSRQKKDKSGLHEIILTSFNLLEIVHVSYYNIHETTRMVLFPARYQTKTSGTDLSKVHGIDIGVDPNLKPEKTTSKKPTECTSTVTCSN